MLVAGGLQALALEQGAYMKLAINVPSIYVVLAVSRRNGAVKTKLVILVSAAIMLAVVVACGVGLDAVGAYQPSRGYVTIKIQDDSRIYHNGDAIPLNWGTVHGGTNTKTVTITNNANVNLRPHLTVTLPHLPRGWTLTLSLENQLIRAGRSATGTITLTLPAHPTPGNYNWRVSIALVS